MANGGYIRFHRSIFSHHFFAPEPYTEREAWTWLIAEAAWKPCTVRVRQSMVEIGRGELIYSTRFLAKKWRWDRSHVRRFIARLIAEKMVDPQLNPQLTHKPTHLTICNYDKFQTERPTTDPQTDPLNDPKKNTLKEVNTIKEKKVVARATRFPDNFKPDIQFALDHGLTEKEAWTEVDKMRDWSISAPGQKGVRADWPATWRNWIRRWSPPSKPNGGNGKIGYGETAERMINELREKREADSLSLDADVQLTLPPAERI